ncbi:Metallo-dependent hydrolase [Boletus edulis]|nr:Metallo-dependent hydrolase [Boletus edulis]
MVSYSILHKAYVKIFLHAAKHPHKQVNGVLLGKLTADVVTIHDVVPLLHHWTSLSPVMEIGLDLAKGHAESLDLSLVGYYQACERMDDTALAPVGERVAEQIRSQFDHAITFVIDGDALGSGEAALIPYLPQSGLMAWRLQAFQPPAFTPGSRVTLANPESPSVAVALVRDSHMHQKFGDFDDHLEDVTIDWLRNSACNIIWLVERTTRQQILSLYYISQMASAPVALQGTLVHCPALGKVEILQDYLLLADDRGVIVHLSPSSSESSQSYIHQYGSSLRIIPPGSFLFPTFCDLHLHAPQFMYQGTGLDLPLMEWLDNYAYKAEESLDQNPHLAIKVYRRLAQRLIEVGTGAVLLFGTIKTETNLILAQEMQTAGVRAFVGKLSMDKSSRPTYQESSVEESYKSVEEFIHRCRASTAGFDPHQRLVEPVITPRFVPTCSDELLAKLGELSQRESTRIQSHLAESFAEAKWVRDDHQIEDIEVFKKYNLLKRGTIQAHCTFLTSEELDELVVNQTAVAHCPLSNAYFSEKPFPLREALDKGVLVGLGTDIAGGYSIDILSSMRHAVATSRMREGARALESQSGLATGGEGKSLAVEWKESLFLATHGGALALGLETCGEFRVGASLDAQQISVVDWERQAGIGALDFFDLDPECDGLTLDMIEKWWCMGDARNRVAMWVQGRQL